MKLPLLVLLGVVWGISASPFLEQRANEPMSLRDDDSNESNSNEAPEAVDPCTFRLEALLEQSRATPADVRKALRNTILCAGHAVLTVVRLATKIPEVKPDTPALMIAQRFAEFELSSFRTLVTLTRLLRLLNPVAENLKEAAEPQPKRDFEDFEDPYSDFDALSDYDYGVEEEQRDWQPSEDPTPAQSEVEQREWETASVDPDIYNRLYADMDDNYAMGLGDWEDESQDADYVEDKRFWEDSDLSEDFYPDGDYLDNAEEDGDEERDFGLRDYDAKDFLNEDYERQLMYEESPVDDFTDQIWYK